MNYAQDYDEISDFRSIGINESPDKLLRSGIKPFWAEMVDDLILEGSP